MKLMLIMTLLIVSLMTVVGAFLINSVANYYTQDFYTQMSEAFGDPDFLTDLGTPIEGEEDGASSIAYILNANSALGIDNRNRKYYVLDGTDGHWLAGSDEESAGQDLPDDSRNLMRVLAGEQVSSDSTPTASYMDVAVAVERGGSRYIVYVLDNGANATALNSELITLIVEALIFGLIISVLLSFLLSKTLTTPIERLTEGAERVADGDFSHKIEVASRDEIGVLTGTFNDMAQQLKRTLEEVENERTKLGTLFLHMTDGVVAFSRDGTVIQSNPAAERMLGRAIPIGGGESYDTLFSDVAPLQGVLAVEQPGYLDGEREVDGRSLELLLTPFDQERLGGVLVVIHDVTEQRKTEEMRREFVANVSHELRTPLTNIRSYAETLADNAGDIPPETEKNFLGVILNESDRMTHIVQDLLTLSRFDSGRSELNLAPFDFGEAVRDVYQANRLEAQRHGHTMELELPGSLPEIVGDRERILQVMMNVVSNSIKYTPDGGRIRLSAGVQGKRVWMEVADNGIGIPKEDRGRIFERFYRVDKARSRESGGTGLGLSIAKEIIDRHQGTIELVDRPGPGLTVRITLLVEGPGHGWK
ncbi:MAG TPA: cell wall metabolism sensor histidine kinase WalK [Candidatus Flavonifractor avistercoris]|nr:ATP-binding protein [Flavonifractor sp. An10]OUQ84098.1 diguanylate cyclase [Flavonifractor sp. An10]HJB70335.1 cell wall metabolism sensor histidine kinase WalK [Candidatus Flavonifractor avistercoris]